MSLIKSFLGMNFPVEIVQDKNVRLKLTSKCQWSCHFCHMEGLAGSPELKWSGYVGEQILNLMQSMGRTKVHLTGGEPTIYRQIPEVVSFFRQNGKEVAITTNGQFTNNLRDHLIQSGCSGFSFSLPTLNMAEFIKFHKREFSSEKARSNISRSIDNMSFVKTAGMKTDINMVFSDKINTMSSLLDFAFSRGMNVSLLNVLGDSKNSSARIIDMISCYDLEPVVYRSYQGTSRARYVFRNKKSDTLISLKVLEPVFLSSMCDGCPLKNSCDEKFYGIRIEQGKDGLLVRTCVHKNVLTPIEDFPDSYIGREVLEVNR